MDFFFSSTCMRWNVNIDWLAFHLKYRSLFAFATQPEYRKIVLHGTHTYIGHTLGSLHSHRRKAKNTSRFRSPQTNYNFTRERKKTIETRMKNQHSKIPHRPKTHHTIFKSQLKLKTVVVSLSLEILVIIRIDHIVRAPYVSLSHSSFSMNFIENEIFCAFLN